MTKMINFTPEKAKEFKKLYEETIKEKKDRFEYEGTTVLTGYAKYLIQYMEAKGLLKR